MKLLIATAVKEDLHDLSRLMQQAGISVFSVSEITGHKTEKMDYIPGNWFGKNEEGTDAIFLFSFTEEAKADNFLTLVKNQNETKQSSFPIRAFICPVEKASF